jgi:hypothetical protein
MPLFTQLCLEEVFSETGVASRSAGWVSIRRTAQPAWVGKQGYEASPNLVTCNKATLLLIRREGNRALAVLSSRCLSGVGYAIQATRDTPPDILALLSGNAANSENLHNDKLCLRLVGRLVASPCHDTASVDAVGIRHLDRGATARYGGHIQVESDS